MDSETISFVVRVPGVQHPGIAGAAKLLMITNCEEVREPHGQPLEIKIKMTYEESKTRNIGVLQELYRTLTSIRAVLGFHDQFVFAEIPDVLQQDILKYCEFISRYVDLAELAGDFLFSHRRYSLLEDAAEMLYALTRDGLLVGVPREKLPVIPD